MQTYVRKIELCCFRGVGLADIEGMLDNILAGCGPGTLVVVHAGGNGVEKVCSKLLKRRYVFWRSIRRILGFEVNFSGILPRVGVSADLSIRVTDVNQWLHGWCRKEGVVLVNMWGSPYGHREHMTVRWRGTQ